jgi:DNA invertase Pin-like site-specific DNA recombinase
VNAAEVVECNGCPTCLAPAGFACRTKGGDTAHRYHTARLVLAGEPGALAELLVPADRGPGRPWQGPDTSGRTLRLGYACAAPGDPPSALDEQLSTLSAAGCAQVFHERVEAAVRTRPALDEALCAVGRERRSAPARPVALAAASLDRVARNAAELISITATLRAVDVRLELLAGPLAGSFDPGGEGALLFDVLGAAAALDRAHLRDKKLAGQQAAAGRGIVSGRPRVFDAEMLALAHTLRDAGMPVPEIAQRLTIATGKNAGRHPSVASVYRALEGSPHDKYED